MQVRLGMRVKAMQHRKTAELAQVQFLYGCVEHIAVKAANSELEVEIVMP